VRAPPGREGEARSRESFQPAGARRRKSPPCDQSRVKRLRRG
jgi:hypothetical protein